MNDMISRQKALDCFHAWVDSYGDIHEPDEMREYREIENLPGEQPEIIQCCDCEYGIHAGRGNIYLCTVSPEEIREHKYDFYCGYADRKER